MFVISLSLAIEFNNNTISRWKKVRSNGGSSSARKIRATSHTRSVQTEKSDDRGRNY